jgi:hypothetical protein
MDNYKTSNDVLAGDGENKQVRSALLLAFGKIRRRREAAAFAFASRTPKLAIQGVTPLRLLPVSSAI